MSGEVGPGAPPPEVPEEFAAIYRAAYEEAMRAQSAAPTGGHALRAEDEAPSEPVDTRRPTAAEGALEPADAPRARRPAEPPPEEWDLPERRLPLLVGTHRDPREPRAGGSAFERLRDSGWLVPLLLLVLALALVLGAYVVGRIFAGSVAHTGARSVTAVVSVVSGPPPAGR